MTVRTLARLFSHARPDRRLGETAVHRLQRREHALVEEFARRMPHIPLVQDRTGQDDSALGTARFGDLLARPRRLIPTASPGVTYVELTFRYITEQDAVYELNLGPARVYARIEDPLFLGRRRYSVEQIRADRGLREAYFRKVFALMAAQSDCQRELSDWMRAFLLPETGSSDHDLLATLQNFNHNIVTGQRQSPASRRHFQLAMQQLDFGRETPGRGPVALRLSVRPHRRPDGAYAQSVTTVLAGTNRGPAFRDDQGKVTFSLPGDAFERRFRRFVEQTSADRLERLRGRSWRTSAEERIWGGRGECEAYFHNHDTFVMKGVKWTLERSDDQAPKVLGAHHNVAVFRSGKHRVAVKAVPFESVGDLVRLTQAHQYVHGVQAPALLAQAQAYPQLAGEILRAATGLLSAPRNPRFDDTAQARRALDEDWSGLFKRNLGPLLHQVTVDYDHRLLLAVLDWSAEGMLSDFHARKRLLEDCSLSHRLRMAANLFRNGHQMLEDDVTHTDLKAENILNLPGAAFSAQQKARKQGWGRLSDSELERLMAGEPTFEGDFSGIYFGREGAVDNLSRGEGLPTSLHYSSWKFASLGLSEGIRPTVLRVRGGALPGIDALLLEQDIANRGTAAWEIVYGSLLDCFPPTEEARRMEARRTAQQRAAVHLAQVIRARREGREDAEQLTRLEKAMRECDRRLLDVVSLRSETIDNKSRITPLFQHAADNRHGLTVWLDPRVIDMLDHLACDFRHRDMSREHVAKLYRTAEALLRAEAGRLERADQRIAAGRRQRMVSYMRKHRLHFNPDCGLLGLADLPRQLEAFAALVNRIPDPRRALNEFTRSWLSARQWGGTVLDALEQVQAAAAEMPTRANDKGRAELCELFRSALLKEHESRIQLESCLGEETMRPPHLGLFERRKWRVYRDHDKLRFSHSADL